MADSHPLHKITVNAAIKGRFAAIPFVFRTRGDFLTAHPPLANQWRTLVNAWLLLILAGMLETGWAVGLKYTAGFTKLWPSVWTATAMVASMWLLAVAVRELPVGTAYPV